MSRSSKDDRVALGALVFLVLVTAAWWALALWPAPASPPEWLARARWVCFNAGPDGMPDASGWLLLVGQPLGMLAVLLAIAGGHVRRGLAGAWGSRPGRVLVMGLAGGIALGLTASAARVVDAAGTRLGPADVASRAPRLDRVAPDLLLLDQRGQRLTGAVLAGRPALVTFAFGDCQTICPAVVRSTLDAQERIREKFRRGELPLQAVPRVVIVSLDPWRDTPSRLEHLASHWELGEDAYVLSGSVEEVEAVLDAWNVVRQRDPRTGDVTHPALVYVVDADGTIAYATRGRVDELVELVERTWRAGDAPRVARIRSESPS